MECIEMRFGNVRGASVSDVQYLNRKTGWHGSGLFHASALHGLRGGATRLIHDDEAYGEDVVRLAPYAGDDDVCSTGCSELGGVCSDQLDMSSSHSISKAEDLVKDLSSIPVDGRSVPVYGKVDGCRRDGPGDGCAMFSRASVPDGGISAIGNVWGHCRDFCRIRAEMAGIVYPDAPCPGNGAGHSIDARKFRVAGSGSVSGCGCGGSLGLSGVLYVGGYSNSNSSNAPNYGLSYANANNSLSNSNTNIGGRLTKFPSKDLLNVESASRNAEHDVEEKRPSSTILRKEGWGNKGNSMPRSIKKLRNQIVGLKNIRDAADVCCSRRKDKLEVLRFKADYDENILNIQRMLVEGTYKTSPYRFIQRYEHGKLREIGDLPLYPDRIIRQAFAQVIEPLLDRKLIPQSHASREGHGIHSAIVQARKCIDENEKVRYCLSVDAHHCYKSIVPGRLKSVLRRYIGDDWTYGWLCCFIDAYPRPGICIGDRLSPLYCNLYFNEIDHYMYEVKKCHGYVAYADNRFIFGNSKKWLLLMEKELDRKFSEYGLTINPNWHIADLTKEGVDFLGFRLFKTHTLLRKTTKQRFIRAMKRLRKKLESGQYLDRHDVGTLNSYKGLLRWCNSKHLYDTYCKPVVVLYEVQLEKQREFREKFGRTSCRKKKVNS